MTDILHDFFCAQIKTTIAFDHEWLSCAVVAKFFLTVYFDLTLTADDFDALRSIGAKVIVLNQIVARQNNPERFMATVLKHNGMAWATTIVGYRGLSIDCYIGKLRRCHSGFLIK